MSTDIRGLNACVSAKLVRFSKLMPFYYQSGFNLGVGNSDVKRLKDRVGPMARRLWEGNHDSALISWRRAVWVAEICICCAHGSGVGAYVQRTTSERAPDRDRRYGRRFRVVRASHRV